MAAILDDRPARLASAAVQAELWQWRAAHPTATFAEIEAATDRALAPLRTALVTGAAHAAAVPERPQCPRCARPMQRVGLRRRTVRTAQDKGCRCTGQRIGVRPAGPGFSPWPRRWPWGLKASRRPWSTSYV